MRSKIAHGVFMNLAMLRYTSYAQGDYTEALGWPTLPVRALSLHGLIRSTIVRKH